ncbi:hypothetical protein JVT61DRAFT_547 [Boletus reticuloceps]|uniref:Uncharacterized protein n=1 Tax=Boletus reticuloceps TaxID=495285 RepID=A0A8I2YZX6_9AGAM|nr:hypothetical protein JVT61DRAFT_547 [Boletus reticuloceps]
MSRDDYHQSANFISDSERGAEKPIKEGKDEGTPLAGDHGGELAEGYSSRQPPTTAPDAELAGAGDDPYGGLTVDGYRSTQLCPSPPAPACAHGKPRVRTRRDEYAGSFASTTPEPKSSVVPASGSTSGPTAATVAAAAIHPARVPLPDTEASTETSPVPALGVPAPVQSDTDPAAEPGGPHSPSIGTRLVGRVERIAGKVFRDSSMEARGKRHMTGHL